MRCAYPPYYSLCQGETRPSCKGGAQISKWIIRINDIFVGGASWPRSGLSRPGGRSHRRYSPPLDIPHTGDIHLFQTGEALSIKVAGIWLGLVPACRYNPPVIISAASPLSRLTGKSPQ